MNMTIDFLFPKMTDLAERMQWESKEVIRDLDNAPQLFERITLSGPTFEQRGMAPFVRVGDLRARIVDIDQDGLSVKAYFDQDLPDDQPIEFGYHGEGVIYRFPTNYRARRISRIERKLLPKEVRVLITAPQ
jgi:hypothetical protein